MYIVESLYGFTPHIPPHIASLIRLCGERRDMGGLRGVTRTPEGAARPAPGRGRELSSPL